MKAHLLTTEFPIASGQDQTADCGEEISHAQIVFMWDGLEMGKMVLSSVLVCRKCIDTFSNELGARYLYGIVEKRADETAGS